MHCESPGMAGCMQGKAGFFHQEFDGVAVLELQQVDPAHPKDFSMDLQIMQGSVHISKCTLTACELLFTFLWKPLGWADFDAGMCFMISKRFVTTTFHTILVGIGLLTIWASRKTFVQYMICIRCGAIAWLAVHIPIWSLPCWTNSYTLLHIVISEVFAIALSTRVIFSGWDLACQR